MPRGHWRPSFAAASAKPASSKPRRRRGRRPPGWQDQTERLPEIAIELARRPVSVIAAFSTMAARAAKAATTTVPIVLMMADDPVAVGIVASLSRPGGNVTGVTFVSAALGAKRLELLRALVPNVETVAVCWWTRTVRRARQY